MNRNNNMLERAITLANIAHNGQLDKAGLPYILHPLRVMHAVWDGRSENVEMVAAVLHDVLEDTDVDEVALRIKFSDEVCNAVVALTRNEGESYREYVKRCALNPIARKVKLADIADNMIPSRYVAGLKLPKRYGWATQFLLSVGA